MYICFNYVLLLKRSANLVPGIHELAVSARGREDSRRISSDGVQHKCL